MRDAIEIVFCGNAIDELTFGVGLALDLRLGEQRKDLSGGRADHSGPFNIAWMR